VVLFFNNKIWDFFYGYIFGYFLFCGLLFENFYLLSFYGLFLIIVFLLVFFFLKLVLEFMVQYSILKKEKEEEMKLILFSSAYVYYHVD
jgi:hypothetical protein